MDLGIQWATDSPFDHACMVGNTSLIEALWHVQYSPLDKYALNGWRYTVAGATVEQKQAAVAFMVAHIGRTYGLAELAADAGRTLLHLPLWPRVQPRRFTCSGLVYAAWLSAGVQLTFAPWPSPMDLAESPLLIGPRPWGAGAA